MAVLTTLTYFPQPRPAVMVVSHERSGTHFLMNTIAACFGYVSLPWVFLDAPTANLFETVPRAEIYRTLLDLARRPLANIIKSHYPADLCADNLAALTERYIIFAIVRDPAAVMLSLWRLFHKFDSDILGPRVADPLTFANTAPSGRMTRFQPRPYATMLERWADHVESWHAAATRFPRVHLLYYEELDERFVPTVDKIGTALGQIPLTLSRPARDYNVIPCGPADPTGSGVAPDVAGLRRLCRATVGTTMQRLGY